MPEREVDTHGYQQGHPPTCTCPECAAKRLREAQAEGTLRTCPSCRQESLFWSWKSHLYECLNMSCGRKFTHEELTTTPMSPDVFAAQGQGTTESYPYQPAKQRGGPKPATVAVILVIIGTVIGIWHNQIAEFLGLASTGTDETTPVTTGSEPGGSSSPTTTVEGFNVFNDVQPPYAKTSGIQVNLVNSPTATNPTWQQLMVFIDTDETDEKTYNQFSFPCGAFAEEVHNNAEAAGIKAALVAIEFADATPNHACNAFQTTDEGLVFIDCTGEDLSSKLNVTQTPIHGKLYGGVDSRDTVAYVKLGEVYGLISMDNASYYGLNYSGYRRWQQDMATFESEYALYIQRLGGRTFVPEDEYRQLTLQMEILDSLAERIGGFYEPFGPVSSVKIYW